MAALTTVDFTRRERQCLDGLLRRESYQEIAERLEVSIGTVSSLLSRAYLKLDVDRRAAAAIAWREIRRLENSVEGSEAWSEGVRASVRKVEHRLSLMREFQPEEYRRALEDVKVHLLAMLERGTERSTTPVD